MSSADNENGSSVDSSQIPRRGTISLGINISADVVNRAIQNVDNKSRTSSNSNSSPRSNRDSTQYGRHGLTTDELSIRSSVVTSESTARRGSDSETFQRSLDDMQNRRRLQLQHGKNVARSSNSSNDSPLSSPVLGDVDKKPIPVAQHKSKPATGVVASQFDGQWVEKAKKFDKKGKSGSAGKNKKKVEETIIEQEQDSELRVARVESDIDVEEYTMLYGGNITVRSQTSARVTSSPKKKVRPSSGGSKQSAPVEHIISLNGDISVRNLADQMAVRVPQLMKWLMTAGQSVNINSTLEEQVAEIICEEHGFKVKKVKSNAETLLDRIASQVVVPSSSGSEFRPPVVTIMGHVDHGKTSLLDAIRKSTIADKESGGITQRIGAYMVYTPGGKPICFIDTPGHAAFSEMRARGSRATDIVILVVAADDGVMAQTLEAISHIKAAEVPIIVALTKIDKSGAKLESVKQDLAVHGVVAEEYGGDVMVVPVSALTGDNLDGLLSAILSQADMMHLVCNPSSPALGVVVESIVDKSRGPTVTLLVQDGTLKIGDIILCGKTFGKVRIMRDCCGHNVRSVGSSVPVEVVGLQSVPKSGERFLVVNSEKEAAKVVDLVIAREQNSLAYNISGSANSEQYLAQLGNSGVRSLNTIIKCDANGSVEAICAMLLNIKHDEVKVTIVHRGIGCVSESDVALAVATGSIILSFNVKIDARTKQAAEQNSVDIRSYTIIYDLENDVKSMMSTMLDPTVTETLIGKLEIRKVFAVSKVGNVAGCIVTSGPIHRGAFTRVMRSGVCVASGKIISLKNVKDDVKEVRVGQECGVQIEKASDIIREGDVIEVYKISHEARFVN